MGILLELVAVAVDPVLEPEEEDYAEVVLDEYEGDEGKDDLDLRSPNRHQNAS